MKITMFIGALGAGGAERALIVLAEGFFRNGHDVTILTWIDQEADFYPIPEGVTRVQADIPDAVVSTRWYDLLGGLRRLKAIKKAIAKTTPDIVISFLDGNNELMLLSSLGKKYKKILSCQNDMSVHPHFNSRWEKLRNYLYKWADRIVFLDDNQSASAHEKNPGWSCAGIPNPVVDVDLVPDKQSDEIISNIKKYPVRLVAMGRLVEQKGFDLLINAFRLVKDANPEVCLVILGEGPLRNDLRKLIDENQLSESIYMPGQVKKPHSVIASCDIFVFSSRYEGQGLALVEAMSCGVPAVSFDCPSGPSYIIENGVDGVLVPAEDVGALSKAITMLINDEEKRNKYALQAKKSIKKYSIEKISTQWEEIFSQIDAC